PGPAIERRAGIAGCEINKAPARIERHAAPNVTAIEIAVMGVDLDGPPTCAGAYIETDEDAGLALGDQQFVLEDQGSDPGISRLGEPAVAKALHPPAGSSVDGEDVVA